MKINQLIKLALLLFVFSGIVACSSSSDEAAATTEVADTGESDADAAARRAREEEEAARARAAAAEERMRRSALATKVFYFDFDVAQFRPGDREVLTFHARDLAGNPGKRIRLEGDLDDAQRERLLQISKRCPVHNTGTAANLVTLRQGFYEVGTSIATATPRRTSSSLAPWRIIDSTPLGLRSASSSTELP